MKQLEQIRYLRVIPTQANYVMCEVIERNARDICCALLKKDILIKDLTHKINDGKQYIRLAVRTVDDNDSLVDVLKTL